MSDTKKIDATEMTPEEKAVFNQAAAGLLQQNLLANADQGTLTFLVNIGFPEKVSPVPWEMKANSYPAIKRIYGTLKSDKYIGVLDAKLLLELFRVELSEKIPEAKGNKVKLQIEKFVSLLLPILKAYIKNAETEISTNAIRKSRSFQDSELYTLQHMEGQIDKHGYSLFFETETEAVPVEWNVFYQTESKAIVARSYRFLTDALFAYAQDFAEGNREHVKVQQVGERRFMIIEDSWKRFCGKAGATKSEYKQQLYRDIEKRKFDTFNLKGRDPDNKNRLYFSVHGFVEAPEFGYKVDKRVKNLTNAKRLFIETITLMVRQELFQAVLYPHRKTKGELAGWRPIWPQLELKLRTIVDDNKTRLKRFCTQRGFKTISGGYIMAIRPLCEHLTRERQQHNRSKTIDGREYVIVDKDLETIARMCCPQAFFVDSVTGKKKIKRSVAVEHITFSMEVIQLLCKRWPNIMDLHKFRVSKDRISAEIYHVPFAAALKKSPASK